MPLAWLTLQAVKSIASFLGGWVADRLGPAKVVLAGWSLYALSYGALAFSPGVGFTFGAIAFYGLYHALAEGAEKAVLVGLEHGCAGLGAGACVLVGGLGMGFTLRRAGAAPGRRSSPVSGAESFARGGAGVPSWAHVRRDMPQPLRVALVLGVYCVSLGDVLGM